MNQLLDNIVRLMKNQPEADDVADSNGLTNSSAAVPAPEEAEILHPGKRRIKENYTSHWDLDYLPRAEADKILSRADDQLVETPSSSHAVSE